MKASIQVTGGPAVQGRLRHIGERVVDSARKMMHSSADKIVAQAKINAPVEKYRLEESIRKEVSYGHRGRLQIDIVVGGTIDGVNVDQYAAIIHERYEDIISDDPTDKNGYTRREATKIKQRAHPESYVGGKFLDRAADPYKEKLRARMAEAITQVIEEEKT